MSSLSLQVRDAAVEDPEPTELHSESPSPVSLGGSSKDTSKDSSPGSHERSSKDSSPVALGDAPKVSTPISLTDPSKVSPPISLTDRVRAHLQRGTTVEAIARAERISLVLAGLIVDDMKRRGMVSSAETLCASGLGACGGGNSDEVLLHCAGCPLIALPRKRAA